LVAATAITYILAVGRSRAAPTRGAQVYLVSQCAEFGHLMRIFGNGFGAQERLTVYEPSKGAPPDIRSVTVTADRSGSFRAALRAPRAPRNRRAYRVQVLAAAGSSGAWADTATLIATSQVCRYLRPSLRR